MIHQGDVFERSVDATRTIVKEVARGTDDDANWLYLLAAMCVGRPGPFGWCPALETGPFSF